MTWESKQCENRMGLIISSGINSKRGAFSSTNRNIIADVGCPQFLCVFVYVIFFRAALELELKLKLKPPHHKRVRCPRIDSTSHLHPRYHLCKLGDRGQE